MIKKSHLYIYVMFSGINNKWMVDGFTYQNERFEPEYRVEHSEDETRYWLVVRSEANHGTGLNIEDEFWYNPDGSLAAEYPIEGSTLFFPEHISPGAGANFSSTASYDGDSNISLSYLISFAYNYKNNSQDSNFYELQSEYRPVVRYNWEYDLKSGQFHYVSCVGDLPDKFSSMKHVSSSEYGILQGFIDFYKASLGEKEITSLEEWEKFVTGSGDDTIGNQENTGAYDLLLSSLREDMDSDGTVENIELINRFNSKSDTYGKMILNINGSETDIANGMGWDYRHPPGQYSIPQKDGKNHIIVVTRMWDTNKVGSTGEAWYFTHYNIGSREGNNTDLTSVSINVPVVKAGYINSSQIDLTFPELGVNLEAEIKYERSADADRFAKQIIEEEGSLTVHPLDYCIRDLNGDGLEDVCSESLMYFMASLRIDSGRLLSFYEACENNVSLAKIILLPPYDETDKESLLMNYVYDQIFLNGGITIDDKGIVNPSYYPSTPFSKNDIERTIEKGVEAGHLKWIKDRVFFNY
jgi:hypothetical protein